MILVISKIFYLLQEFSIDMLSLYRQFSQFSASEVIGCGVTQTPFYIKYFQDYKLSHPGRESLAVSYFNIPQHPYQRLTLVDQEDIRDSTLGSYSWIWRKCGRVSSI